MYVSWDVQTWHSRYPWVKKWTHYSFVSRYCCRPWLMFQDSAHYNQLFSLYWKMAVFLINNRTTNAMPVPHWDWYWYWSSLLDNCNGRSVMLIMLCKFGETWCIENFPMCGEVKDPSQQRHQEIVRWNVLYKLYYVNIRPYCIWDLIIENWPT